MNPDQSGATFRDRLGAGERLVGTFVKTGALSTIEILAGAGFDFLVIDQEHAPLDRNAIDAMLVAARACGTPALVRVSGPVTDTILSALDCGASGVLVPHVASAELAAQAVRAGRYGQGGRGYSGAVRAAGYGASAMADYIARADRTTVIVAQIEDREALDEIDAIATTDGIDALFIGRADLAISLGETSPGAPRVMQAAVLIAAAASRAGKPLCIFAGARDEALELSVLGTSVFVAASDQSLLRRGAAQTVKDFTTLNIGETGEIV